VGYFDEAGRFWFCGRQAHRVTTTRGTLFTIPCEAIINTHPRVYRSALVGIGEAGSQRPVVIVETWPDQRVASDDDRAQLLAEVRSLSLSNKLTAAIDDYLHHPKFPVDIRHNAKIFREQLAAWAGQRVQRK
jgi:acyl-coenzyme A synthetase/AMP-(fatty) acid ligase